MEDATQKISRAPGEYYLFTPKSGTATPLPSHGILADRLSDAPPSKRIDDESLLGGRFDIIGKYGYASRELDNSSDLFKSARQLQPPVVNPQPPPVDAFFNQLSGRSIGPPCTTAETFYRPDITPAATYRPRESNNFRDTRLDAKDAYSNDCKLP